MEPRLTATSVIRSPRYYGHFVWSSGKNNHTFSSKETLVNTVGSLSRPDFFGPLVTVLTGVPLYEEDHSSFFWWLAATWFFARQVWTWVVKRPTLLSTHSFYSIMLQNKLYVFVARFIVPWAINSAEASLCCREAGETEKDGAGDDVKKKAFTLFLSSPARFLFFDHREPLRRREYLGWTMHLP